MIVQLKNGKVNLVIITAGSLNDTRLIRERLLKKINNYLEAIHTQDFKRDFGEPPAEKFTIVLKSTNKPHPRIIKLLEDIQENVKACGASLEWELAKA